MAANWDLFGDETKLDGGIAAIGLICLEAGLVSQVMQHLIADRDRILNLARQKGTREVHWKDMDQLEADIALEWIDRYFRTPLMFFVYIPSYSIGAGRLELVKNAIARLETDPHVPHGLARSQTTLHLDYDSFDIREFWRLQREFGLLRAFPWDSHGSPLLQLSDVLLGISHSLYTGSQPPDSNRGRQHQRVIDHATKIAIERQRNFMAAYAPDGQMRILLPSRACSDAT